VKGLALVVLALALAGCGGSHSGTPSSPPEKPKPAATGPFPDDPQLAARATSAKQQHDLVVLARDIKAMRTARAKVDRSSLHGTPATRETTNRFLLDLDHAKIDDLSKNRVIDHAAAAVATVCEQCFQQLEAVRPIPAIAH
jgi:hypothetical protein